MRNRILRILITVLVLTAIGLTPATPALAAAGTIALSTLTGTPGSTISVSGTGFTLGGTPSVVWGGTAITAAGSVNATGALIGCSFIVPSSAPRGTYTVGVITSGGDTTSNSQSFYVTPAVQLEHRVGVRWRPDHPEWRRVRRLLDSDHLLRRHHYSDHYGIIGGWRQHGPDHSSRDVGHPTPSGATTPSAILRWRRSWYPSA